MSNEKLARIQGLSDEVHDFHPLLNILFRRLPDVSAVEYRQGPREMGADFVVEKRDGTLLSTEYIGVIVKTGKIKQDHHDINRQVEECELDRTFQGGKKKIHLTELWVVSNNSISHGAQDKINHKYKNKSIKFLSGEKIVDLVDRFYPEFWTDVSVRIGEYFRKVEASAAMLASGTALLGSGPSFAHIEQELVPVPEKKFDSAQARGKVRRYSLDAVLQNNRFVLVESSMGTGKSTLLANAARKLADASSFNNARIAPVLCTVKDVKDRYDGNVAELVSEIDGDLDGAATKFVVLLDGLDELHIDPKEQDELLTRIKDTAEATDNISVVIASRPLAVELEATTQRTYKKFMLTPFSVKQVISLVDAICNSDSVRRRLLKDLEKSNLFKVLPKTPISAILLAKLLKENVHEIPSTMTELYGKYMELVMGRWDMSKALQSQTEYEVIYNVSINIAQFVIDNSLDMFSVGEARSMFEDYVGSRNLKIDSSGTFEKLITRSEVFAVAHDRGVMSFRHRTFAEYLYAVGLERDGKFKVSSEVYDPYWNTIYFFFFGIKRDAIDLVDELSSLPLDNAAERFAKLVMLPNILLAAYLTPYSTIAVALRRYFDDVASLYVETVNGEHDDSPLAMFSSIQLLCIFTQVVASAHSYEFFHKALKECADDIYSNPSLDNERDLAELFFVNSALASLGDQCAYETLLDQYGPAIPLPMKIGVVEHSADTGLRSEAVAKYAKRVRKSIKSNPAMRRAIEVLYSKPVASLTDK